MPSAHRTADEPLIVIESGSSPFAPRLGELRRYADLLYFLIWRDIKVQYRQAVLGVLWAVLQPLLLMLVFVIFYARVLGANGGGVPYPLFAYAGFALWTFFSNAITSAGNSLVNSVNLITRVYFPRMVVPAAAVCASLVQFVIASSLVIVLMLYYRIAPGAQLVLLPVVVLLTLLFALAVGLWTSALNVKYRDVRLLLPFAAQVGMFVSSVIVPSSAVPERWRWLLLFNPMSAYVEAFRVSLFGGAFDGMALASAAALTFAALLGGVIVFRNMERGFADVI